MYMGKKKFKTQRTATIIRGWQAEHVSFISSSPYVQQQLQDEPDSCCTVKCDQQRTKKERDKGLQERNIYSSIAAGSARTRSDDGAGVGILLAEDGGEPVGVSGDSVDALAHRRRVVAPVLPGEVLVPPRRRLAPRQRRRRVPQQVRRHRWTCLTTVLLLLLDRRVAGVRCVLLLLRFLRLRAEPDAAAGLLVLASFRTFRWLRLGRCFLLGGRLLLGRLGWCLLRLLRRLWCALLLLLLRWRRRLSLRWDHVDVVVAGEGHRPHVVGLQGRARRVRHRVVQPLLPPSFAPCTREKS
jgi:hypothetical protein